MKVGVLSVVWRESPSDLERFGTGLADAWARLPPERRDGAVLVESAADREAADAAAGALAAAVGAAPRRIRLDRNRGPAHAYNTGLRELDADYVTLFDPDGLPAAETLERLVAALDDDGRAAAAAAAVVPFSDDAPRTGAPVAAEWVSAGATVYRASALRSVGGFDELFAYACEEMDLGYRLRKAGWNVLRVPAATFRHEVAHKASWSRELRYVEFLMVWRHIHFSRGVTLRSWLRQLPYVAQVARRDGWRVGAGALLGLFAYLRHVPACERRR